MHIVIIAAVDFPAGPATTSRVKNIARILVAAGNRVTVASLQANTKTPYSENSRTEGEADGIRYTYLNGNLVRPSGLAAALADTAKGCFGACSFLWRRHRERGVDLVLFYTPDFFQTLPAVLSARLLGIPMVLELCEINSSWSAPDYRKRIRGLGAVLTDRLLPRLCSGVIVVSSRIRELLLAGGVEPDRIFHLPVLVDCRRFSEPSRAPVWSLAGKRYFLNSGALGEKDGSDRLLRAFALICRHAEDVYLAFTGEPDPRLKRELVSLARQLEIERRLVFTGFLSEEQLVWAYQNALALLCCRNGSRYANYGSPTKVSEYLCSGRPVITNEVGDSTLYLVRNESAFFARVEDEASIAAQMWLILRDPALAAQVGSRGQQVAREFFHYENYVSSLDAFVRSSCPSAWQAASATRAGTPGK